MGHAQVSPLLVPISFLVSPRKDNRIDFLMYAESAIYSPISGQCLTRGMKGMNTPATGLVTVLSPMPLDLLLLGLTIVKTFKSKTLLESHPSSPIVGVVFHFGFFLGANSSLQMRAMLRDEILYVGWHTLCIRLVLHRRIADGF